MEFYMETYGEKETKGTEHIKNVRGLHILRIRNETDLCRMPEAPISLQKQDQEIHTSLNLRRSFQKNLNGKFLKSSEIMNNIVSFPYCIACF